MPPARDHVTAVLSGVVAEDDPSLVGTLLGQATRAAGSFAPVAEQAGLLARISADCWAAPVEAGSDLQLVRVRAAVSATDDGARLLALLDGSDVPPELVVDEDLRWHIVRRAAALGMLGQEALDRELAADPTASGRLQAEAAAAGRPDAVSKQACWELLAGGTATNAQVRAQGGAFWQRGQDALLAPYVDRYLDALPGWWAQLSPQLAGSLTQQLFPATAATPDVVARVEAALARPDLAAGLRRLLAEQLDDLQRVLRARQ